VIYWSYIKTVNLVPLPLKNSPNLTTLTHKKKAFQNEKKHILDRPHTTSFNKTQLNFTKHSWKKNPQPAKSLFPRHREKKKKITPPTHPTQEIVAWNNNNKKKTWPNPPPPLSLIFPPITFRSHPTQLPPTLP